MAGNLNSLKIAQTSKSIMSEFSKNTSNAANPIITTTKPSLSKPLQSGVVGKGRVIGIQKRNPVLNTLQPTNKLKQNQDNQSMSAENLLKLEAEKKQTSKLKITQQLQRSNIQHQKPKQIITIPDDDVIFEDNENEADNKMPEIFSILPPTRSQTQTPNSMHLNNSNMNSRSNTPAKGNTPKLAPISVAIASGIPIVDNQNQNQNKQELNKIEFKQLEQKTEFKQLEQKTEPVKTTTQLPKSQGKLLITSKQQSRKPFK
ncbi:MAG: hypothetical protein EZS28_040821, partial [Streblomastix strix]